ncbi:MAG: carboxypeptidase regulatory-like domain-containing protein [Bryobacterales bacterium]|nr:carboxypeptidase regulatory-like domain-containing protein [Bryobacterales bacterium]
MTRFHSLIVLAGSFLLLTTSAFAQGAAAGSIRGQVTDPSDAAVAGVTITVTNSATGVVYSGATTSDGFYNVRLLPPGTYSVSASATGFQQTVQNNIVVSTASNPTVNLKMQIGALTQTVTVTEQGAMVEAQTADRGNLVDSVRMDNTPSQARNLMGLVYSTAGTIGTSAMKSFTPYDNAGSSTFSINGGQPATTMNIAPNQMVVDGVDNRTSYNGGFYGLIPTQESVQEMKVITSPYSAEFGRTMGGVINVVTKSGTNEFHGGLFYFARTTGLSANQFERNLARQPKLAVHFHTPGGMIGGPIKKNKLFFFFETQRLHTTSPKSFIGQVPTQLERDGDFRQSFYNNGGQPALQMIYDPWTVSYNTDVAGHFTRQPFAGNVIPSSRFNSVAKNFWQYIPLPNSPGDPITKGNNYTPQGSTARGDLSEFMSRVDYNINETNMITFRHTRNNFNSYDVPFYPSAADPNAGGSPFTRANHNAVVDYTRTLSPTSVFNIKLGLERYFTAGVNPKRPKVTPAQLGFSPTFVSQAYPAFPFFSFGGGTLGSALFSGAGTGSGNTNPDQINTLDGSWSKTISRHTIKAGAFGRLERYYAINAGFNAGSFGFSGTGTNFDPQVATVTTGNPVASFLLGVGSASIDINAAPARQNLSAGWYVQDDINVTPKLKINLGLRWDWNGAPTDRYNAMTGIFDTTVQSPLAAAVKSAVGAAQCPACSNLRGGLTFPGVNGMPRNVYDSSYRNFQPRLGIAYSLDNKTVIRAGWGLFYGPLAYDPGQAGFSQTTSSVLYDPNLIPINLIDNPFPTGLIPAVGARNGLATNIGTGISFIDPHAREPRSQQFSFDVQREIPWNVLVTAGYVYNGMSRVAVNRSLNSLTVDQLALGASVLNNRVANPFAGLVPGFGLNQATITYGSLLVPYPQFTGVTEIGSPIGDSAYHGLQIQMTKRFSQGVSYSAGYTVSKHMGRVGYQYPTDNQLEKLIDIQDVPQVFTFNASWELPFGRGKIVGGNMPAALNYIVGGWKINGMIKIQRGMPYQISPNTIPLAGVNRNAPNQNVNQWVNPAAYVLNTNNYIPRRWSTSFGDLRVPPIHNFDLAVAKDFKITERVNFEFMNNWVNAFNTPQWYSTPGGCASASALCFGRIAGFQTQTNLPRQIQLAGKITF